MFHYVEVSGSGLAEHEPIRRLTAQALWYCLGQIRSSTAYALLLYSHVPRYHTGRDYMHDDHQLGFYGITNGSSIAHYAYYS
jgi:hypothetical protein